MRKTLLVLSIICVASLVAAATPTEEWPHFRGPDHNGTASSEAFKPGNGMGFKVVWKKELGSGYSSISVADGRAITMFSDGDFDYMIALDAATGKELWRYKVDETYEGHSGSHDGTLSTPAIDEGVVYGVGPKGQFFALKAADGSKVWETKMQDLGSAEPEYGWTTSPLIWDKFLILQTGAGDNKMVSGFDKKTGEVLWTTADDAVNYQSPALVELHGKKQLVCVGNTSVVGLEPGTGDTLWQLKHDGRGEVGHPIAVGNNRVYVRHAGREGMLIEVKKTEAGLEAAEVWRSSEIKRTDTPSVYHNGYLYGYSGPFLTCINVADGTRAWRSREPGDGFVMTVNDYLVSITKRGNVHAAMASPEGYADVASLEVFDHLGWAPPSFAYNKIFVRTLQEIACIELAKTDRVVQVAEPEVRGVIAGSKLDGFAKKLAAAGEKNALLDSFFDSNKQFPIIEDNKLVHVVYRGEAEDMAIAGDMLEAGATVPLNRVEGTDFYYYSFELAPDAVIAYNLVKDYEQPITDPLNPLTAPSFGEDQSLLPMPKWSDSDHLAETELKGTMESFEFESTALENKRQIQVYVPPGYADSDETYPVVYMHYGDQAAEKGLLARSLDNLIGKTVRPAIIVFVGLNQDNGYREVNQLRDEYVTMVVDELIPHIEKKYRVQSGPETRASMGASAGGFISLYIAFKRPGVFGWVVGHSTNVDEPRNEEARELIESSEKIATKFFLHWGAYDVRNSENNLDRAAVNRTLYEQLGAKGYEVFGGEMQHGYGWGSWRTVNDTILETLFPLEGST